VQEDLSRTPTPIEGVIALEDVRNQPTEHLPHDVDLALFSPPYPNNIDYTEVYKLELWALGLVDNDRAFARQRRRTLRSHGSLKWDEAYEYQSAPYASIVDDLMRPVVDAIPKGDRYTNARRQLVMGYADDMLRVAIKIAHVLRPRGVAACVVGNSLHGHPGKQLLIAADLLIARLFELVGLEVTRIEIARRPRRRASCSRYLRESIVFARRRLGGE
jgi:hypothetical protein